jgi:hypothetical protein
MKIYGLWVDIQEVHGPFCKVAEIKEFLDLIYNRKFCGPSPRCGGPAARSGPRWTADGADTGHGDALPVRGTRVLGLVGACCRGATGRGVTWGNSMGCSPGHGQQRGGRATEGTAAVVGVPVRGSLRLRERRRTECGGAVLSEGAPDGFYAPGDGDPWWRH